MQRTSVQKQKKSKKIGGFYMFKKMKHMKNEKGLTLIELLAVIVILAIIAAIAIPAIGSIIENSRVKALKSDVANVINAAQIYYADGATADFVVNGTNGTGDNYVKLTGISSVSLTVGSDGKLKTGGSLVKGSLTFGTTAAVSLGDLKIDAKDKSGTGWTITSP